MDILRRGRIKLVGGDLKVMSKGGLNDVVVTTASLGFANRFILDSELKPEDKILINGAVDDHTAALAAQEGFAVEGKMRSDISPLTDLIVPLLEEYNSSIHATKDPTRRGLVETLNEWASETGYLIVLNEAAIPLREDVRTFTEMMGVDPLTLACEGRAISGVELSKADEILEAMKDLGHEDARIIDKVKVSESERYEGLVITRTRTGGLRVLEPPSGVIVPRIR